MASEDEKIDRKAYVPPRGLYTEIIQGRGVAWSKSDDAACGAGPIQTGGGRPWPRRARAPSGRSTSRRASCTRRAAAGPGAEGPRPGPGAGPGGRGEAELARGDPFAVRAGAR